MRYLAVLLLFVAVAQAAPLSPADRDAVRQQQEQLLRQNQQQRDELERATPLPRAGRTPSDTQAGGPCFDIHTITLSGVTLISAKAQQKLLAPWQNQCLNMAKITELTAAISDWYISRGYITSRAFLTEQDLSQGELRIVVLEGKLRDIRLNGESPRMLKMVFPDLKGKVLNLRDIEQGMEQINRLRSQPVQIEIVPDSEPGYSLVNVTATPEFPLSASVSLDNNGQITTGSGTSTLSGSNIVLNGNSSLQGGGDVTLASRGNITANGFAGTLGSLTLSAPGSIVNTALLYAANNLALYANSITNQRGDMLAGNNLWLQRDAAGNANAEVINTSGNIETRNGDIAVNTGHLLNQRDGLTTSRTHQVAVGSPASGGASSIRVRLDDLSSEELGIFRDQEMMQDTCNGDNCWVWYKRDYIFPNKYGAVKKFLVDSTIDTAQANGGAGRIASGRKLTVHAGSLDNLGSDILAGSDMVLSGSSLNNQSYTNSAQNEYIT